MKLKTKSKKRLRALNEARNDYLMALIALNSAQEQYDKADLPKLMEVIEYLIQKLDGTYYESIQKFLVRYAQYQKDCSAQTVECAEEVEQQAGRISRKLELDQFLADYQTVFKQNPAIPFEPAGLDSVFFFNPR
jgi:hypothetical protein